MKATLRAGMLLAALFLTACAGISEWGVHQPVDAEQAARSAEARELAAALGAKNANLKNFKGSGRFKLRQGGKLLSARVAWAGSYPDKLRIAVMNVAGQPTVSLAADGCSLYMVSHTDGKFYEQQSADPTLQRLISIRISARDIISILTARLPVRKYHFAALAACSSGQGYVLTLEGKRHEISEKIYLHADKQTVSQIELFGSSDKLSYRTVFEGKQQVSGYELPQRIVISDTAGNLFELDIEKYWTEVLLEPSTFVLTPP